MSRTPRVILRIYVEQLPRLQAEEQLWGMQASAWPHLHDRDRERARRWLVREAGGIEHEGRPLDPQQDADFLATMGIGVREGDD